VHPGRGSLSRRLFSILEGGSRTPAYAPLKRRLVWRFFPSIPILRFAIFSHKCYLREAFPYYFYPFIGPFLFFSSFPPKIFFLPKLPPRLRASGESDCPTALNSFSPFPITPFRLALQPPKDVLEGHVSFQTASSFVSPLLAATPP